LFASVKCLGAFLLFLWGALGMQLPSAANENIFPSSFLNLLLFVFLSL
jgi:hypothetical protein